MPCHKKMGVHIGEENFGAIELIKNLEVARNCLEDKHKTLGNQNNLGVM